MNRITSGVVAVVALLGSVGCVANGGRGSGSSTASEGSATAASVAGRTVLAGPEGSQGDGFLSWIGLSPVQGPAAQRQRMLERAGTSHFKHEELARGKVAADERRAKMDARRDGLVSPEFTAAKASLRGTRVRPERGEVLGEAAGIVAARDPALARSILAAAAASQGIPVTQPALAYLFPNFGN